MATPSVKRKARSVVRIVDSILPAPSKAVKGINHMEWQDRFFSRLVRIQSCWILHVPLGVRQRYPCITYKRKLWKAHRFSYWMFNGDIPEGMCVCHQCDNPSCVNPHHLFLGTQRDNVLDMHKKGRYAYDAVQNALKRGQVTNTKISDEGVRFIRASKEKSKVLAEMFNTTFTYINQIRCGMVRKLVK
jgi:hypothetical protein